MTDTEIHGGVFCIVSKAVLEGAPVSAIVHDGAVRANPHDAGFTCYTAADPDPIDVADLRVMCLHCLIDLQPAVGAGLDAARRCGTWEVGR